MSILFIQYSQFFWKQAIIVLELAEKIEEVAMIIDVGGRMSDVGSLQELPDDGFEATSLPDFVCICFIPVVPPEVTWASTPLSIA